MELHEIELIIAKYLSGEHTEEEAKKLTEWSERSPENKAFLRSYGKANINAINALHQKQTPIIKLKTNQRYRILELAAAACIIFMVAFVTWRSNNLNMSVETPIFAELMLNNSKTLKINTSKSQYLTDDKGVKIAEIKSGKIFIKDNIDAENLKINVPRGKKLIVVLPDFTEVNLNSASVLSLSSNFNHSKDRIVRLSGEGLFSVSKNPHKPFYVYTDRFVTQVLGTKFNINSYEKDQKNSVILLEGKISVKPISKSITQNITDATAEPVILKPGESLLFVKNTTTPEKNTIKKTVEKTAWTKNEIVFEDEQVEDILRRIERTYDVKIINQNLEINKKQYSGSFKDESLENILKTITTSLGCTYEIKGNEILIKK